MRATGLDPASREFDPVVVRNWVDSCFGADECLDLISSDHQVPPTQCSYHFISPADAAAFLVLRESRLKRV